MSTPTVSSFSDCRLTDSRDATTHHMDIVKGTRQAAAVAAPVSLTSRDSHVAAHSATLGVRAGVRRTRVIPPEREAVDANAVRE